MRLILLCSAVVLMGGCYYKASERAIPVVGQVVMPSIRTVEIKEAYCPDGYKLEDSRVYHDFDDIEIVQICHKK